MSVAIKAEFGGTIKPRFINSSVIFKKVPKGTNFYTKLKSMVTSITMIGLNVRAD